MLQGRFDGVFDIARSS